MIHLLMPHPGHHVDPATLSAVLPFFCRVLRLPWRKPAAPAPRPGAGAATALLGEPVMRDRMIADVRAEHDARRRAREHADAMQAGYARAVDRLRAEDGLPTVEEMRQEYFGLPKREPMRREPGKPPWWTTEHPVYGQAPQLAVEPELAKEMIA